MAQFTPMMQQYFKVKEKYPDAILFYRLGDFYEMFFDDAKTASRELELVLTGRDCGQEERAPMCGIPYHAAENYIARLVSKGYKVAIAEQMEDPSGASGIVERSVVRVLTPGTVIESNMLDEGKNNYLCCLIRLKKTSGICFADVSTGQIYVAEFSGASQEDNVINEIARYMPTELLYNEYVAKSNKLNNFLTKRISLIADMLSESNMQYGECKVTAEQQFGKTLQELELEDKEAAVIALGATISYLRAMQKHDLANLKNLEVYKTEEYMALGAAARSNLELCETQHRREKKGSLLWVMDSTKTPMGKRLVRSWLERPLTNVAAIRARQNAVTELYENTELRDELISVLSKIGDIERILTRVVYGTANAKELKALSQTTQEFSPVKSLVTGAKSKLLLSICDEIDELADIYGLIDEAINDDPPFSVREGNIVKDGFNTELDQLRLVLAGGKDYLACIERQEQEKTGIKKLKVGYNRVFGYYIEVLNAYKALVPDHYVRKQTLSNCERYITQELKELETKVLSAKERIESLEYEIFVKVRDRVAEAQFRYRRTAQAIAQLDVLCSFAKIAVENGYICPEVDNSDIIEIRDGRHPVVEKFLQGAPFVPNDTILDCNENRTAIITGPNMAGKSTYMRQTAIIVLMAQIGSFVPAKSARIGIVDAVFTRVGASDDLSAGQSTFMLEMSEVADIVKHATKKSLIILDEIGRGTSTYDGMSIARAVMEYITDKKKIGAKTLFATHYHELTDLETQISGVKNYNISVKKRGDDIIFLRRIVRGGADGSFGVEVAQLAGVPKSIVARAKEILAQLESEGFVPTVQPVPVAVQNESQLTFSSGVNDEIIEELKNLDVNTLTPIEALTKLYELKSRLN